MDVLAKLLGREPPYSDWPKSYDSFCGDMAKAAGVAVARVRCHRNTWAYLQENVPQDTETTITGTERGLSAAFKPPAQDEITSEEDGLVTVPLSGTTLAAVLSWCHNIQPNTLGSPWTALDRSIARRVGAAISQALDHVVPSSDANGPTAVIYLDDRMTAKDATA
ncbi:hypothetical protein ACGRHY_26360 [Streptomyces sp. HK10]|uniref:hypothetical protein n=1 Tax=Streptomyces sp. HK10 TaxID=3373255 RepID=UPI00374A0E5E